MFFRLRNNILLLFILLIALTLRFYNLMHDAPYFFNPDERNMANAVSQLRLPHSLVDTVICLKEQFTKPSILPGESPSCNLNPRFFAYGQFPLYLAFGSHEVTDFIVKLPVAIFHLDKNANNNGYSSADFYSAVFWLRFWSAATATLVVFYVYLITKKILDRNYALLAAFCTCVTPGLIQAAHFGTTESLLSFFFLAIVYHSLSLADMHFKNKGAMIFHNIKLLLWNSLLVGLALGTKLTGSIFIIPPVLAILISYFHNSHKYRSNKVILLIVYILFISLFLAAFLTFTILASPYNIIDFKDFYSAVFGYEKDVAMGTYRAFYTQQFANTLPVLFQLQKIFPYTLGLPVFFFGFVGFLVSVFKIASFTLHHLLSRIKFLHQKRIGLWLKKIIPVLSRSARWQKPDILLKYSFTVILVFSFFAYFLPNAFLYAKWTRFMTPVFPFFSIFTALIIYFFTRKFNKANLFSQLNLPVLGIVFCFFTALPGIALMSVYTHEDVRVTASRWIYKNIPNNSYILFETGNVIDIPLGIPELREQTANFNIKGVSFDFYHVDGDSKIFNALLNELVEADYIFIPSRRVFANYTRLPSEYPLINKYYSLLFSGQLGFREVAQFSSSPTLGIGNLKMYFPDESAEESYTVFDHPVIRIYKKEQSYGFNDYLNMFQNN